MQTQTYNPNRLRMGLAMTGLIAGLLFSVGSAMAQTTTSPAPGPDAHKRFEERCKADPQKCEAMKKRFEERQAACEKNPEVCQKQREERRAKRDEHRKAMKAECEKDPEACKQKREAFRQKMEERCKADPAKCDAMKKRHPDMPDGHRPPPPAPTAAN